jgi:hemoglobin/transferrin/lactoferrin receptor protein
MDDAQAKDIATVVRTIPGVNMGGSPREAGQIPSIRGYQGPDIIIRVDDARRSLDTSVGIYTPLFLDPNFVKQIDVVRGPSSATYGGGGLGGVLAFQTIDAEDIIMPGQSVGGRLKTGWRSGDNSHSANLTAAAQAEGASILASGTIKNYHAINTGAEGQNQQDGLTKNALLKLGFEPNEMNKFKVSYSRFHDDGYGPTNPSSNDFATTGYQQQKRTQDEFNGNWTFKDRGAGLLDGKVTAYYNDMKYDNQKRTTQASDTTMEVQTTGGTAQNTSSFETWVLGHRLTYGVDGYHDSLTNTSRGGANSVNPDGKMLALGGFMQDEIQVARDWTVIATLREDNYDAEASGQSSNSNHRLSPKVAVKWQALQALGFFASYGDAFRAPTLTELYNNLSGTGNFSNFRANAALRPEVSRGKEIGATLALNDLLADKDALKIKVTGFDENVKDLISSYTVGTYTRTAPYAGTGSIFQYQNVSHAHRWGAEAELSYRIEDWSLGLGLSRLRVKDVATGANLFAPPDKATLGLGYYIDDFWSVRYAGRFVASQDYDTTTARRRRAYAVHDIGTSYDRDWYRVDFGISNLFDKGYSTYHQGLATSYVYEEGRSVNMTLTARF